MVSMPTKRDTSQSKTLARLKGTSEHFHSWTALVMIVNMVVGVISIFFAVLIGGLQFLRTDIATIAVSFMTVALVVVVSGSLHNRAVRAIATRFDFVKLYWYQRAMAAAITSAVLAFFILFFFMILASAVRAQITWEVPAIFVSSGMVYLIAAPIALYTKPFSSQGEAYLCLTQALRPDTKDAASWLTRGFDAFSRRLEELEIHVSPRTIIFAINMKVLKGEHFEGIVKKMAAGIMEIDVLDKPRSIDLYEVIKNLNCEAASGSAGGVGMVPSYGERIFKGWDFFVRSAKVISFVIIAGLIIWTYIQTGKISLITP